MHRFGVDSETAHRFSDLVGGLPYVDGGLPLMCILPHLSDLAGLGTARADVPREQRAVFLEQVREAEFVVDGGSGEDAP